MAVSEVARAQLSLARHVVRLRYVSPQTSLSDAADCRRRHAELATKLGIGAVRRPYLSNGVVCQLGCPVVYAAVVDSPVAPLVSHVFQRRPPTQVRELVVQAIAVAVKALHAFGAWSDKRLKNKAMNATRHARSIAAQNQTAVRATSRRAQQLGLVAALARRAVFPASHATKVAYFVVSEPNYRLPNFFRHSQSVACCAPLFTVSGE